ncbi:MAG: hypothetical protein NTX86_01480, partial [Candidatus Dependentiae bacterium]|nr:hypothetical protein [Candidatus Dependentiae bacterium]
MSNKTKFLLLTALLCINPYLSAMDNKKPEIDTTPKKWFFQRLFNRSSATVAPATITSTISDPSKNVGTPGATSNVAPTPKVPTKPNSTPNETPKSQSTPNTPATNTQKSTTDLTHSLAGPEDLMHRQQASYLSRARNWLWSQERPQPKQELPASTTVTPPTPNPLVNVTNPDPTSKPKPTPNAPTNQNSTPNETPKPQSKLNTPAPKPSTPSDQKPNTNSGWSFGSVDINPDKIRQDRHDGRPRGRSSDHDIKPKEIIPPIDPEIEKSRKAFGHDGFRNLIPEPLEQSPSPSTATSNKNPASTAVPSNTNPSKNNTTPPNDSTPNNTEIPKVKTNDNSSDLDWSFGYKKKDPTTAPPSTAWNVSSYVARSLATSLIMDIFFNDENERIESWNAFVREYEAKLKKEAEERAAQKIELAKQERIQLDDLLQQASQLQEIEFTNDKLSKKAKLERAVRQEKKQRDASYVFDARCRVRDSWQNFKQNVSNIWDNGIINTLNNGKGGYWHQSRFAIPSQRIFINSYFAQEMFEAAFKKDPIISPAIFKKIVCNREKVQENLIQTQKAFNELNQQGILDDNDQEIVQALERAVSERGAPIHKNYNQLTSEAKKLLADCGVDPKNFEGMVGNALQVHLFDR